MPPDWDADSPELRRNLAGLLQSIEEDAPQRKQPTVETARRGQVETMRNLQADDPRYVGAFRGEAGLEYVQVHVNGLFGVAAAEVTGVLREFEQRLQSVVGHLDNLVPLGAELNADQIAAIVEVCAWAHAEWVRIHPFANGNGRTARVPGYESGGMQGMFGPAKTSDALVKRLNQEIVRLLRTAEVKGKLVTLGYETVGNSQEEFAALIKSEIAKVGKVIKDAGITAD